jgi:hypothetical protein
VQTCCAAQDIDTCQALACRAMRGDFVEGHILTVPVTFNDLHDCCYNDRSHPPLGGPVKPGRLEQATQTDCASKTSNRIRFSIGLRKCGTKSPPIDCQSFGDVGIPIVRTR